MQITFGSSDPDETPEEKKKTKKRKQLEEERERTQNSPLAACPSPGESPYSSTSGSPPMRKRWRNNGRPPDSDNPPNVIAAFR